MHDQNKLSFGRYLKNIRIDKGISLETISAETRIGIGNLTFIENEDHERLPADVFVKGFLRAYAKTVGADGDDAIRRYLVSLQARKEKIKFEADLSETGSKFWCRLLLALGALCCVILLTTGIVSLLEEQPAPTSEEMPVKPAVAESKPATAMKTKTSTAVDKTVQQGAEKLLLGVRAVEATWMKVQVDEKFSKEYSLKPGERLALEAISKITLLIGNASGVRLKLNNKPVVIKGKRGQVVTVHLPDDI